MMVGPVDRMHDTFGWRGFPHALFYKARYALRFELGGDAEGVPRFLQAMDRARAIASEIFTGSQTLTALASTYRNPNVRTDLEKRRVRSCFTTLSEMGFRHPFQGPECVAQHNAEHMEEFGEDQYRHWYAADFRKSDSSLATLLWSPIANELLVAPSARWIDMYIVDFTRGIVIHPYDDRGMDVIANDREILAPLYARLGDWLLQYDREAMDDNFG